jgi:hypothetical protein
MAQSANPKIRWVKRIGIVAAGWTMNEAVVWVMDFVIYPFCIVTYGPVWGWMWAALASVALDLAAVWVYDQSKLDWFGLEAMREIRDNAGESRWQKVVRFILRSGDIPAFLFLSWFYYPFIGMVYLRKGSGTYQMTRRDWRNLWFGILWANLLWGAIVIGAVEAIRLWIIPHL